MPVDAVVIAPRKVDGKVLIPAGSVLKGKVTKAQPVGIAVVHETAALTVDFDKLELPNGDTKHCIAGSIRWRIRARKWMLAG